MTRNSVKVWITVPTRYLRSSDRNDFLVNTFRPELGVLGDKFNELGLNVYVDWFDPVLDDWGKTFVKKIDSADILLFYHKKGTCWFGKGAADIYDDYYGLKPQYIMYRTQGTDELRFYVPHIKDVVKSRNYDNWHQHQEMSFGMPQSVEQILAELDWDDKPEVKKTPELVPVRDASKWIYLYTSIFANYG